MPCWRQSLLLFAPVKCRLAGPRASSDFPVSGSYIPTCAGVTDGHSHTLQPTISHPPPLSLHEHHRALTRLWRHFLLVTVSPSWSPFNSDLSFSYTVGVTLHFRSHSLLSVSWEPLSSMAWRFALTFIIFNYSTCIYLVLGGSRPHTNHQSQHQTPQL